MLVLSKFHVQSITMWKGAHDGAERGTVKLSAVSGGAGELPENTRYHQATPAGTIEIQVDNPVAFAAFKERLGDQLYVQFSDSREWTDEEKAEGKQA